MLILKVLLTLLGTAFAVTSDSVSVDAPTFGVWGIVFGGNELGRANITSAKEGVYGEGEEQKLRQSAQICQVMTLRAQHLCSLSHVEERNRGRVHYHRCTSMLIQLAIHRLLRVVPVAEGDKRRESKTTKSARISRAGRIIAYTLVNTKSVVARRSGWLIQNTLHLHKSMVAMAIMC